MRTGRVQLICLAIGLLFLPFGVTAAGAQSAVSPARQRVVRVVSADYISPLQFAIGNSRIYVVDSFTDTLTVVGRAAPIATTGSYLDGVAVDPGTGAVAYLSRGEDGGTALWIVEPGHPPVVADLSGYERKWNPDKKNHYGADDPSRWRGCVGQRWPTGQASSTDSRPVAVTALGHGSWAVADGSGNDVLKVNRSGVVTLLALLPAQRTVFTAAMATEFGLPSCVVGLVYNCRPDPSDVEVAASGQVYATTTGGPADRGGSVYDVSAAAGPIRVATGFYRPTALAIDKQGTIYLAEPGRSEISAAVDGRRVPVATVPYVIGLEYSYQHLYASTAPSYVDKADPGRILLLAPIRG